MEEIVAEHLGEEDLDAVLGQALEVDAAARAAAPGRRWARRGCAPSPSRRCGTGPSAPPARTACGSPAKLRFSCEALAASRIRSSSSRMVFSYSRTTSTRLAGGAPPADQRSASRASAYSTSMSRAITSRMPGRSTLTIDLAAVVQAATCTWAMEAAASGWLSKLRTARSSGRPQLRSIGRRAPRAGNGGTWSCSFTSSSAMSGGSRSRRVDMRLAELHEDRPQFLAAPGAGARRGSRRGCAGTRSRARGRTGSAAAGTGASRARSRRARGAPARAGSRAAVPSTRSFIAFAPADAAQRAHALLEAATRASSRSDCSRKSLDVAQVAARLRRAAPGRGARARGSRPRSCSVRVPAAAAPVAERRAARARPGAPGTGPITRAELVLPGPGAAAAASSRNCCATSRIAVDAARRRGGSRPAGSRAGSASSASGAAADASHRRQRCARRRSCKRAGRGECSDAAQRRAVQSYLAGCGPSSALQQFAARAASRPRARSDRQRALDHVLGAASVHGSRGARRRCRR